MYEHGKGLGADGSIEMSKCNLQARIVKVLLLTLQKYKIETNGIVSIKVELELRKKFDLNRSPLC